MFKPFSLSEAMSAGQGLAANEYKLQSLKSAQAHRRRLQDIARQSTEPTYEPFEAETFPGEAPIEGLQTQTGEQFSPERYQENLVAAGEMEAAVDVSDMIGKMNKRQQEEYASNIDEMAKLAIWADDEDKWNEANQIAMERGWTQEPVGFDQRDRLVIQAQEIQDLLKQSSVKAPTTRNIRDGREIVNQEWNPATGQWMEVGRGQMSEQQINLRNKPSEQAAGKEFNQILDQANTAEDQLATIDRARALLPGIEQGKLEPIKLWAREWGNAVGVDVDVDRMSDASAFRSVMKTAVLDGMKAIKGTASEADRQTVEDSVAKLESPEAANKFLLDTAESLAKRNIERANFWDTWAANNDGSLLGARRAWSKRISEIPLVKKVGNRVFHYYQFRDQAIRANKRAFREATPEEMDRIIDDMWTGKR